MKRLDTYKPHMVIATGLFPPQIGGPSTYSKLLSEELPRRGWEVSVVNFGDVLHLPKGVRHVVYMYRLFKALKYHSIIYAQDPVSVGLPVFCVAWFTRQKFGIRIAGDWAWEQSCQRAGVMDSIDDFQKKKYSGFAGLAKRVQSFVSRQAHFVVTPSLYFKDVVVGWGVDSEKVHAIYNGIVLGDIYIEKESARQELRIEDDSYVIFSAGRLVPWKGFETLIDVVRELNEVQDKYLLYIVGDGPDREKLTRYITETNMDRAVSLVGSLDADTMKKYLRASDVFVLNTSFESFSFQTVEAMAAGVPIVTTAIGNLREIVDDGVDGLLVEPNNQPELISAIRRIESDDEFRKLLIENGYEKVKQFSIERTVDNLVKLLLSV